MNFSDHDLTVIEMLRDDQAFAIEYLKQSFAELDEENGEVLFLFAIRHLVEARGGVAKIAREAGLNRETLYRTLSRFGNPTLSTTKKILHATGVSFAEITNWVDIDAVMNEVKADEAVFETVEKKL